jgi:hypothetical protein
MSRQLHVGDLCRFHEFSWWHQPGAPECYIQGVVLELTEDRVFFAILHRVWEGQRDDSECGSVGCCPPNDSVFMDDPAHPRIEFIKQPPSCFRIDGELLDKLDHFKQLLRNEEESRTTLH